MVITAPNTSAGKWSVGLNALFVIAITTSMLLVLVLNVIDFDDHWWDVTVAMTFPASIIGFIIGIVAVKQYHERSSWVKLSILIGFCTILFVIFHSLFIND